jgi:hypothetical protein
LYGTWTTSIPATDLKSSPDRWFDVPWPKDAKSSLPGCDLARATSSFTFFAGTSGCTTRMFGTEATSVIGAKSFSASNGMFL